jgi:hypothetical protein
MDHTTWNSICLNHRSLSAAQSLGMMHTSITFSQTSYSQAIKPRIHTTVFPLETASNFLAWLKHDSHPALTSDVFLNLCAAAHVGPRHAKLKCTEINVITIDKMQQQHKSLAEPHCADVSLPDFCSPRCVWVAFGSCQLSWPRVFVVYFTSSGNLSVLCLN